MRKLTFLTTLSYSSSNFIQHRILICEDKDPLWFNKKMKGLIQEKSNAFKSYHNNISNTTLKNGVKNLQVRLNSSIEFAKQK